MPPKDTRSELQTHIFSRRNFHTSKTLTLTHPTTAQLVRKLITLLLNCKIWDTKRSETHQTLAGN